MPTKVLVFESDSGFAGELKSGLARFGCTTSIVDDANVGLQAAASEKPNLILLSIELPRMNGFSVCNKLKRDPTLKDVPLIIMSSDSTEETFEQHRRLRTRAEDYVHKPIPLDDLVGRIRQFVRLEESNGEAAAGEQEDAIVIDDEILLDDIPLSNPPPPVEASPDPEPEPEPGSDRAPPSSIDDEVDNFAEQAFGALMDDGPVRSADSIGAEVMESIAPESIAAESIAPP
jgi:CheY-like chemotaxis protein